MCVTESVRRRIRRGAGVVLASLLLAVLLVPTVSLAQTGSRKDNGNSAPKRESAPPPRRDPPTPRRDDSVRRDTAAPRRDDSFLRSGDRVQRYMDRTSDRAPRYEERNRDSFFGRDSERNSFYRRNTWRELDRTGTGNIFDRRAPAREEPSRNENGNVTRTLARPQIYNSDRASSQRDRLSTAPSRNPAQDIFLRSAEGRRYQNGVTLRSGGYITHSRIRYYFPHGYCYFPYYRSTFDVSVVFYSPYYFYYGVCPPYIYRPVCHYRPPVVIYIEVPIYTGGVSRGYDDDADDYYLDRDRYRYESWYRDRGLDRAIEDIEAAFRYGDIERLVYLTDPQVRIAVFRRGKYEYSLDTNDYLDMTRDALRVTDTLDFDLYRVRRRSDNAYVASGVHLYRNREGQTRKVYVSFGLEYINGRWIITQVGTAPDRIE